MLGKKCKSCGSENTLLEDFTGSTALGALICTACGFLNDSCVDESVEVTDFSASGEIHTTGTFLGFNSRHYCQGDVEDHENFAVQARKRTVRETVSTVCQVVGLQARQHEEMCMELIGKLTKHKWGSGKWMLTLVGSCVLMVAKRHDKPVTLLEVSEAVRVNGYILNSVFQKLSQAMEISSLSSLLPSTPPTVTVDPILLAPKVINSLFEKEQRADPKPAQVERTKDLTIKLLKAAKSDWLAIGRRPTGLLGGAILIVTQVLELDVPILRISQACHIAVHTIQTRATELKQLLVKLGKKLPWGDELTPKNVLKHALDIFLFLDELKFDNCENDAKRSCAAQSQELGAASAEQTTCTEPNTVVGSS